MFDNSRVSEVNPRFKNILNIENSVPDCTGVNFERGSGLGHVLYEKQESIQIWIGK